MDGKIVAGNPNQVTTEGYDQANKIRYNNDDFRNQYEEGTEEDFNRRAERNNRPEPTQQQKDEAKEKIIAIRARKEQEKADEKLATQEKINKIKAARAAKAAEENRTIEERKALEQEIIDYRNRLKKIPFGRKGKKQRDQLEYDLNKMLVKGKKEG